MTCTGTPWPTMASFFPRQSCLSLPCFGTMARSQSSEAFAGQTSKPLPEMLICPPLASAGIGPSAGAFRHYETGVLIKKRRVALLVDELLDEVAVGSGEGIFVERGDGYPSHRLAI